MLGWEKPHVQDGCSGSRWAPAGPWTAPLLPMPVPGVPPTRALHVAILPRLMHGAPLPFVLSQAPFTARNWGRLGIPGSAVTLESLVLAVKLRGAA